MSLDFDEGTQTLTVTGNTTVIVTVLRPHTHESATIVVEQHVNDRGHPVGALVVPCSKENLPPDVFAWVQEVLQESGSHKSHTDAEHQGIRITVDCGTHTTDGCQSLKVGHPFYLQIIAPAKGSDGRPFNKATSKWLGTLQHVDHRQPSLF